MNKILKRKILFLILLLITQITSFGQNDYKRAHLWEKEIAAFADADKKEFPKTGKVLFVGSSSIRGWRTLKQDFPDVYTINRGFGGSHLEDVNHYAPQIVLPYKPKLIVLYAGENDIAAGKSVETVFNDFKNFVSFVRKELPKTRLIVISAKPSPSREEFASKYKELNGLMKAETEKDKRTLYVDVWAPMLDESGEPKKDIFLGDKLHMNAAGYKIWRETLLPHIKKGLKSSFR
ncbi:MAG TPA: SGNH/GDSL hydrolase family protein [Pyrinomonadaceae bacterium]|jgi:lysophospholipase L1-like esterase